MAKQLVILCLYVNFKDYGNSALIKNRYALLKQELHQLIPDMPKSVADLYHIMTVVLPTTGEMKMECVYPKEYDKNVIEKMNQIQKRIDEWLQQQ